MLERPRDRELAPCSREPLATTHRLRTRASVRAGGPEAIARPARGSPARRARCRAHRPRVCAGGSRPRCTARHRAHWRYSRARATPAAAREPRRGCRIGSELCHAAPVQTHRFAFALATLVIVICARLVAGGETWDDNAYQMRVVRPRLAAGV